LGTLSNKKKKQRGKGKDTVTKIGSSAIFHGVYLGRREGGNLKLCRGGSFSKRRRGKYFGCVYKFIVVVYGGGDRSNWQKYQAEEHSPLGPQGRRMGIMTQNISKKSEGKDNIYHNNETEGGERRARRGGTGERRLATEKLKKKENGGRRYENRKRAQDKKIQDLMGRQNGKKETEKKRKMKIIQIPQITGTRDKMKGSRKMETTREGMGTGHC